MKYTSIIKRLVSGVAIFVAGYIACAYFSDRTYERRALKFISGHPEYFAYYAARARLDFGFGVQNDGAYIVMEHKYNKFGLLLNCVVKNPDIIEVSVGKGKGTVYTVVAMIKIENKELAYRVFAQGLNDEEIRGLEKWLKLVEKRWANGEVVVVNFDELLKN